MKNTILALFAALLITAGASAQTEVKITVSSGNSQGPIVVNPQVTRYSTPVFDNVPTNSVVTYRRPLFGPRVSSFANSSGGSTTVVRSGLFGRRVTVINN